MSGKGLLICKMRKRVSVQTATEATNAYGERTLTWATTSTRWAAIEPLRGSEPESAEGLKGETTYRIRMRWFSGLTAANRLLYGARVFEIESLINTMERDIEWDIVAREITT